MPLFCVAAIIPAICVPCSLPSPITNLQKTNFIGRKVILKVIKTAANNCIQKIYLDCVMDNPTLELYYKRYGFRRIAIAEHPRYIQNMVIMVFNIQN